MWSWVSVFDGRKEASGLMLSFPLVRRYDDWCRLVVSLKWFVHWVRKDHTVGLDRWHLRRGFIVNAGRRRQIEANSRDQAD